MWSRMEFLDRYSHLFGGYPAWLVLLCTLAVIAGSLYFFAKLLKWGFYLMLAAGLLLAVAGLAVFLFD